MIKNGYEDGKIKRVCFAKSIDGSLRGMSQNLKGIKLYVHIPDGNYDVYNPTIKEVPDCKITGEVWIKEPVKLKCIGLIEVINDTGEDGIPYKYGNNTAELYDWDWKWIEKINESYIYESKSTLDNNYKAKGKKNLSSFKIVHITESIINKYKKEYPFLRNVRCKDTKEYICDGYIWFDNDELVAMVGSCEYTDDKTKWIVSLEITDNYKGYGLSKQILDYATKTMNCKYLSVNKNNEIAKKVYDDYGFKVYQESDTMYYMTIDKNIKESYIIESCKTLKDARKLCNDVRRIAKKYDANFFFVTDGASAYSNGNGEQNPAAKEMRNHMDEWEKKNGFNPDDDWSNNINDTSNYKLKEQYEESYITESNISDLVNINILNTKLNMMEYILVTSTASSNVRSGSMVGSLLASILLPVPGGPMISMLCPPAAAISIARLAPC